MNDQFKRMQKLAGLITEGMGAYEYEKGKEAGEKIEKKKMKKSELKKQIKEMILAEMDIDITNDADFYDPVYEARISPDNRVEFLTQALQHVWNMGKGNNSIDFKDMAKSTISDMFDDLTEDKEINEGLSPEIMGALTDLAKSMNISVGELIGQIAATVGTLGGVGGAMKYAHNSYKAGLPKDIVVRSNKDDKDLEEAKKKKDEEEVEDITVDDTEMTTEPASISPSYDVQKELMDALEAAKSIGDEKLVRQIGNALTYFTRTQVADKEAPTMSEGIEDTDVSEEAYDRMNGLVNQNDLKNFIDSASNMMRDLTDEGFEPVEVFYYLYTRLTANV